MAPEMAIENLAWCRAANARTLLGEARTIAPSVRMWRSFRNVAGGVAPLTHAAIGLLSFERWSWSALVRSGALLIGLALVGFAWARFSNNLSPASFEALILARGAWGPWLFLAIATVAVGVGAPRQAVAFVGAYCFGFWPGAALGLASSVVSAALDFAWARGVGRATVRRIVAGRFAKIDRFLGENPFHTSLMLRLLPIGNNVLINVVSGVSDMSASRFLLGSAIGYVPQTIVFALIGTGTRLGLGSELGLAIGLFVASAGVGIALFRRQVGPLARFFLGRRLSGARGSDARSEDDPTR